jgi:hypothetical protein
VCKTCGGVGNSKQPIVLRAKSSSCPRLTLATGHAGEDAGDTEPRALAMFMLLLLLLLLLQLRLLLQKGLL